MEGTVQEDDYRTEVQFKDKNLFKNQSFCLLRFTESLDPRITDPGLGSGPKSGSGLNRWHQSGKTDPRLVAGSDRTALPLIGTGTQHTLGPVRISCHWPKDGKKKDNFTRKDRKG